MILRLGSYSRDRYEIQAIIDTSGMVEVHHAFCHKLQRTTAIKALKQKYNDNEDSIRRFAQEALAAAKVDHLDLINVYEIEHTDGVYYIVMEFVDGITLKEYARQRGKFEQQEAIDIAIQATDSLNEVHQQGIVHRDVKPQDMVTPNDGKVKLADFGIVRVASTETLSQGSVDSVHYVSPEHAQGKPTDACGDLYSSSIYLYEMVTGRMPFDGEEAATVLPAQISQKPVSPRSLNPKISKEFNYIILKGLEERPAARYQSAAKLTRDLKAASRNSGDILPRVQKTHGTGGDAILFHTADVTERASQTDGTREETTEGEEETEGEEASPIDRRPNKLIKGVSFMLLVLLLSNGITAGLILSGMLGREPTVAESENAETESSSVFSEKQIYVPYLTALDSNEAEEKLRAGGLTLIIQPRKNSDQLGKDAMVKQEPKAGTVAQRYSKAYVAFSLDTAGAELSELNLVGTEEESVEKMLTGRGFSVEEKSEYSDMIEEGKVVRLSPKKVKKGNTVTLVLPLGKEPKKVKMPDLTYNTEDSTKQALTEAGLTLGTATKEHSDIVSQGQVIRQGVNNGTGIEKGKNVDLVLSEGPKVTVAESTQASEVAPRYVASTSTNFTLSNLIGPDPGAASITVMVRLRQGMNGQTVYRALTKPHTIRGDAILSLRFRIIEGAYDVGMNHVEIARTDNGQVLQGSDMQFFKIR